MHPVSIDILPRGKGQGTGVIMVVVIIRLRLIAARHGIQAVIGPVIKIEMNTNINTSTREPNVTREDNEDIIQLIGDSFEELFVCVVISK